MHPVNIPRFTYHLLLYSPESDNKGSGKFKSISGYFSSKILLIIAGFYFVDIGFSFKQSGDMNPHSGCCKPILFPRTESVASSFV